tara:strand:+ start:324 stop:773 length:450 start_codon:yes stop_codon:yes gene_type:complete
MYIIFFIVFFILILIIKYKNLIETMGSMSPQKYIIIIDMEYLAKNNKIAEKIFEFMDKNYRTAQLFLGVTKIDAILLKTNDANIYFKSRLETLYPNHIKYHHLNYKEPRFLNMIKDRTILYLSDKKEIDSHKFKNRLLNAEEQVKLYSF